MRAAGRGLAHAPRATAVVVGDHQVQAVEQAVGFATPKLDASGHIEIPQSLLKAESTAAAAKRMTLVSSEFHVIDLTFSYVLCAWVGYLPPYARSSNPVDEM